MEAARIAAQPDPLVKGIAGTVGKIGGAALGAFIGSRAGAMSSAGGSAGAVGAGPQPFSTSDFRVTPDSYQYPGSSQSQLGFWGQFGKNLSSLMMQGS
jgi:hypothetical protein